MHEDLTHVRHAGDPRTLRVEAALRDAALYEPVGEPPADMVQRARSRWARRGRPALAWVWRGATVTAVAGLCLALLRGGQGPQPTANVTDARRPDPPPAAVAPALAGAGGGEPMASPAGPSRPLPAVRLVAHRPAASKAPRRRVAERRGSRPPAPRGAAEQPARPQWVHETVQRPPSGVLAPVVILEQDPASGGAQARPGLLRILFASDEGTMDEPRLGFVDTMGEEEQK
ncbi:MAG TPA: hypothetical protein VLH79_12215 [Chthonomonadales bacterium]|nr:hypothetical protein [Chthonomonadales bacterium]